MNNISDTLPIISVDVKLIESELMTRLNLRWSIRFLINLFVYVSRFVDEDRLRNELHLPALVEDPVKIFSNSRTRRSRTSPVLCNTKNEREEKQSKRQMNIGKKTHHSINLFVLRFDFLMSDQMAYAIDNRKLNDYVEPV